MRYPNLMKYRGFYFTRTGHLLDRSKVKDESDVDSDELSETELPAGARNDEEPRTSSTNTDVDHDPMSSEYI